MFRQDLLVVFYTIQVIVNFLLTNNLSSHLEMISSVCHHISAQEQRTKTNEDLFSLQEAQLLAKVKKSAV